MSRHIARAKIGKYPIQLAPRRSNVTEMSIATTEPRLMAPATVTSCCSRGFAGRIESWLLHSDIQLGEGPHDGAIAGWLDGQGRPEFVYPEIAGYYMTAMAWLASGAASSPEHVAIARTRAQRTANWIAELMSNRAAPPTRLYLAEQQVDWRNDAVFSFDLAMAARGIAAVGPGPCGTGARTLGHLCAWLDRISAHDGIMSSHEQLGDEPPPRWSTRPGPHHLKAAAAIVALGDAPNPLTRMANRTILHWATMLLTDNWPCDELHALCYGLEGLLIADTGDGDRLDQAELIFIRLMQLQSSDGLLRETVHGGVVRSDVLAQALRIGLLLRGRGHLAGAQWAERLDALAYSLMQLVRVDGGVLFAKDQTIANTWCAMFAHQALYLHARRHSGDTAPANAFLYLV